MKFIRFIFAISLFSNSLMTMELNDLHGDELHQWFNDQLMLKVHDVSQQSSNEVQRLSLSLYSELSEDAIENIVKKILNEIYGENDTFKAKINELTEMLVSIKKVTQVYKEIDDIRIQDCSYTKALCEAFAYKKLKEYDFDLYNCLLNKNDFTDDIKKSKKALNLLSTYEIDNLNTLKILKIDEKSIDDVLNEMHSDKYSKFKKVYGDI